jgi:hypothetical protein
MGGLLANQSKWRIYSINCTQDQYNSIFGYFKTLPVGFHNQYSKYITYYFSLGNYEQFSNEFFFERNKTIILRKVEITLNGIDFETTKRRVLR